MFYTNTCSLSRTGIAPSLSKPKEGHTIPLVLADLPSAERIGTVIGLSSFCGGLIGHVGGAMADFAADVLFNIQTEWADALWKKGLRWGAFAAGIWYFFEWCGLV